MNNCTNILGTNDRFANGPDEEEEEVFECPECGTEMDFDELCEECEAELDAEEEEEDDE